MSESTSKTGKPFPSAKAVEEILGKAVQNALLMHKRLRNPIAVYQDGRVVIIPPDEIPVEDDGRTVKVVGF
jgi:hypothetical protein